MVVNLSMMMFLWVKITFTKNLHTKLKKLIFISIYAIKVLLLHTESPLAVSNVQNNKIVDN